MTNHPKIGVVKVMEPMKLDISNAERKLDVVSTSVISYSQMGCV